MDIQVKVLQKGKITIPKELRERLGIKEGEAVTLQALGGRIVILPANTLLNPTEALSALTAGITVREPIDEELRKATAARLDRKRRRR